MAPATPRKQPLTQKEKKDLQEQEEKLLEALSAQNKAEFELNANRQAFYIIIAFLTTLLPSYLFQGVKGLDFRGINIALYLVVPGIAAYLLSTAYHNIFTRMRIRLKTRYDDVVDSSKVAAKLDQKGAADLEAQKEHLTELGATGYALSFTNFLYLAVVLFISFYLLKRVDVRVNFIASLLLSALAVNWFSTKRSTRSQ